MTARASGTERHAPAEAAPHWVPPGVDYSSLPPALRRALLEEFQAAHRELVGLASCGREAAVGAHFLHLAWLEAAAFAALGGPAPPAAPGQAPVGAAAARADAHLRIAANKARAGKFLLEVQKCFDRLGDVDPLGRVPR